MHVLLDGIWRLEKCIPAMTLIDLTFHVSRIKCDLYDMVME